MNLNPCPAGLHHNSQKKPRKEQIAASLLFFFSFSFLTKAKLSSRHTGTASAVMAVLLLANCCA